MLAQRGPSVLQSAQCLSVRACSATHAADTPGNAVPAELEGQDLFSGILMQTSRIFFALSRSEVVICDLQPTLASAERLDGTSAGFKTLKDAERVSLPTLIPFLWVSCAC